jgi:hypothetical protein
MSNVDRARRVGETARAFVEGSHSTKGMAESYGHIYATLDEAISRRELRRA